MEKDKVRELFTHLEPTILKPEEVNDASINIFYNQHKQIIKKIKNLVDESRISDDSYLYEKNNIILVDGGRGSGKTSTLLTIKEYIKKSDEPKINNVYVIDRLIDPSMFNNNDNILQLIVSSMFKDVQSDDKLNSITNNFNGTILDDFNKITNVLNYNIKEFRDSVDMIDSLYNCSNYYDTRKLFSNLVNNFLLFKSRGNKQYTNICLFIDDIDLNIKNSFEMIEQIRKYLKQKNIIIIMGIKRDSLKDVLINKYYLDFEKLFSYYKLINTLDKETNYPNLEEMSEDYIKKVFPITSEVILPNKEKLIDNYSKEFGRILNDKLLLNVPKFNNHFLNELLFNSLRENNQLYTEIKNCDSVLFDFSTNKIKIPNCICEKLKLNSLIGDVKNDYIDADYDDIFLLLLFNSSNLDSIDDMSKREKILTFNLCLSWITLFKDNYKFKNVTLIHDLDRRMFIFKDIKNSKKYYLYDLYNIEDCKNLNDLFCLLDSIQNRRELISNHISLISFYRYLTTSCKRMGFAIKDKKLIDDLNPTINKELTVLNFIDEDNFTNIMTLINEALKNKKPADKLVTKVVKEIKDSEYSNILKDQKYLGIEKNPKYSTSKSNTRFENYNIRTAKNKEKLETLKTLLLKESNKK